MERVTGIGGIFFKARDADALKDWYREHLGMEPNADGGVAFQWREADTSAQNGYTVWAAFRDDTQYFAPSDAPFMITTGVRRTKPRVFGHPQPLSPYVLPFFCLAVLRTVLTRSMKAPISRAQIYEKRNEKSWNG